MVLGWVLSAAPLSLPERAHWLVNNAGMGAEFGL